MNNWRHFHPIQIGILHTLAFCVSARFSELKMPQVTSDRFTFHIKKLQELGLIQHTDSQYALTDLGKHIAGSITSPENDDVYGRHARVGVLIGCVRKHPDSGVAEYLIQERQKHPFYGCRGFMATKVRWGETIYDAASRGLISEQGLTADLTLVGVKHKMDYHPSGELLEDKHFYVFRGDNSKGSLVESFEGGTNIWMSRTDIAQLPNLYEGVIETLDMIDSQKLSFTENKHIISNY